MIRVRSSITASLTVALSSTNVSTFEGTKQSNCAVLATALSDFAGLHAISVVNGRVIGFGFDTVADDDGTDIQLLQLRDVVAAVD